MGSSVYSSTLVERRLGRRLGEGLVDLGDGDRLPGTTAVKSVIEPSGTGTRRAVPSRRPFIDGSTRPVARAAPVEAGTMLTAAARARRRSLWGRSSRFWSLV